MDLITNAEALSFESKSKKKKKRQIKQEHEEENNFLQLDSVIPKKKKKKKKDKNREIGNQDNFTNYDDEVNITKNGDENNINSDINDNKFIKKKRKKKKQNEIEDSLLLSNNNTSSESPVTKKSKKKKKSFNEDASDCQNLDQFPVTLKNIETIQENTNNQSDLIVKKKKKKKHKPEPSEPEASHDNNIEINKNVDDINNDLVKMTKKKKHKKKSHEVQEEVNNELQEINTDEPVKKKKKKLATTESNSVIKKNKKIKQKPLEAEDSTENNIANNINFNDINDGLLMTKPKKRKRSKSHEVHEQINNNLQEIYTVDEPVKKKKKKSAVSELDYVKKKKRIKQEAKADDSSENHIEFNNFQETNVDEPVKNPVSSSESDSVKKKKKKKRKRETEESHENNIEFINNPLEITNLEKSNNQIHEEHEQINNCQEINTEEPVTETSSIIESESVRTKKKKKQKPKTNTLNNNYLEIKREINENEKNGREEDEQINDLQNTNPEETTNTNFVIEQKSLPKSTLQRSNNEQQSKRNLELKPKVTKIKQEKNLDHLITQIKDEASDKKLNQFSERSSSMESLRIDSPCDQTNDSDSDALSVDKVAFGDINLKIIQQKRKLKDKHNEAVDKTRQIDVILVNPVAPLHRIEKTVSVYPKREETLQMEAICPNLKKGGYTQDEDALIKKNFKQFCQTHDLPHDPTPFLNWRSCITKIMQKQDRVKFVQFLGYGLPTRPLYSIYNRFKTLFNESKTKLGRFTKEEDQIIMEYLNKTNSSRPFSDLAKILHRQPLAIERRAIKMKAGNGKRFFITRKSATELIVRLMEVTKCEEYEELRDRTITTEEWKEVGTYFEPIHVNKVRNAWLNMIYSKLFIENDTFTSEIKKKVMHLLVKYKVTDWKDVNWDKIGKEVGGLNGPGVYKYFRRMVNMYVPNFLHKDLKKTLEYLVEEEKNLMLRSFKFDKLLIIKNVYEQLKSRRTNQS